MVTPEDLGSSLLRQRPAASRRRRCYAASAGALFGNGSNSLCSSYSLLLLFEVSGLLSFIAVLGIFLVVVVVGPGGSDRAKKIAPERWGGTGGPEEVESEVGVVAADDWRCSKVGAAALRSGGHAVDAAVATALCLGVVHPVSSGIGGGAFIVVRSADSGEAVAIDSRETAPTAASKTIVISTEVDKHCRNQAASLCGPKESSHFGLQFIQNMYENDPSSKSKGALSMGIPGEIAGLHTAWSKYGRLPWKDLLQPSISLARDGFLVGPYLANAIRRKQEDVLADPGLRAVLAPNGRLLQTNDTCYNPALANALEVISTEGPQAFYNGSIGERFIEDVRDAGGVATMEDLKEYTVKVTKAMVANAMGYTILGMPPPSSGTLGMSLDGQLAGVVGASGGLNIIPAVVQVFLNHFILGMKPLQAVQHPRVFHKLIPNEVLYENFTAIAGEHIEFANDAKLFLEQRGHVLRSLSLSSVSQLIVHNLNERVPSMQRKTDRKTKNRGGVFHGRLIAVSDPRKDGSPAAL
ncbi:hypothetical protein BHM03_00048596 [Ensete ventricosum]|nr:hypothetical protein BHM03_00048596 [Ensete ventricosum]